MEPIKIGIEQLDNIKIHFIVARARTGSTLLATTLGLHENILSITEQPYAYFLHQEYHAVTDWSDKVIRNYCSDFFLFAFPSFKLQFDNNVDLFATLKQHQEILNYERVVKICALCFNSGKEKSVINTIVFKELIMNNYLKEAATQFPKSKFIFLYRHPLDTLCRVKNMQSINKKKAEQLIKTSIRWNHAIQKTLSQLNPLAVNRYINLSYEALIMNTEGEIKRICSFLDLPFQEAMLADKKRKEMADFSRINTEKQDYMHIKKLHQSTFGEINPNKIGVWRKELSEKEAKIVWSICGKTAKKLGYDEVFTQSDIRQPLLVPLMEARHFIKRQVVVRLWYKSPFFLKRMIKKIKTIQ